MSNTFFDLTVVIVIAAILGIIARFLKQPTMVAYLVAGVVIAISGILRNTSYEIFDVMATLGVTLLLFLVGLEMRFDNIKSVGKAAIMTAVGQIVFTSLIGYGIVKLLGFATLPALYISFALALSSTIVVVKLLSQKRDLQSLYGRIVVGVLIVQDVVAILILLFLGGINTSGQHPEIMPFIITFSKSILLFGITFWLSQKVFPWIFEKLARTPELVFIVSIAWAFGISQLVASNFIGLSIEIGGFLAGISLAKSIEQYQIESQLRPLRDFFIVIFFIVLGSSLVLRDFHEIIIPAIIISIFVLIGKPIILLIIMKYLGYRKKTSLYTGITLAQISEFSLILMAMGLALGHVSKADVSLVTLVGIITIIISTYYITHNKTIYFRLKNVLKIFELKNAHEDIPSQDIIKGPIILAGAHRLGRYLLQTISRQKIVVVEFDPEVAKNLIQQRYKVIFGDITDTDIQDKIFLSDAYLLISTIPSLDDNLLLVEGINAIKKKRKKAPIIIVTAYHTWQAKKLYECGADYVVMPHLLGGKHLASLIKGGIVDQIMLNNWKKHDFKTLEAL